MNNKLQEFFDELGMEPVMVIEGDAGEYQTLVEAAKHLDLSIKENRIQLLHSFSMKFDGFFLNDWKRFITFNKEVMEEIEEQAKELIYSVTMRFEEIGDDFYFDVDLDYLKKDGVSDIFKIREDGMELLFPSWGLKKVFIEVNEKDDEIQKLITNLVKSYSDKHQFYKRIYEELPELIMNRKEN